MHALTSVESAANSTGEIKKRLLLFGLILLVTAASVAAQSSTRGRWDPRFTDEDKGGLGFGGDGHALVVHPQTGDVYAAGRFLRRSETPNRWHNIVRWTGDGWEPVPGDFNNVVNTIAFTPDGTLYAGGRFTEVDGVEVNYVARFDGTSWTSLGRGVESRVWTLRIRPETDDVYVGGDFDHALQEDGTVVQSPTIAWWNGNSWERVGYGGDGLAVYAIAFDPVSGDLFVGGLLWGGMRNADSTLVPIDDIGRFDGTNWTQVEDERGRLSTVQDIAFDDSGSLYVAHQGSFGFAVWDRTAWSVPAGGVGEIVNNRVTRDETYALLISEDRIFVGGAFDQVMQVDSTGLEARGVAVYVPSTNSWQKLGEGMDRPNSHSVDDFALLGTELFAVGNFVWAGARPSNNVALWTEDPTPYPETHVTFQVDMRAAARKGLLRNLRSDNPTQNRPLVEVYDGPVRGGYVLFDADGDSIWTANIPQPANTTIDYAFGFDISANGYDDTAFGDWIHELNGALGGRSVTLTSAPEHTLPVVSFDNRPLLTVDQDYEYRAADRTSEERPGRVRLPAGGTTASVQMDFERTRPSVYVTARWYTKDPGGAAPEGILTRSENSYWVIDTAPLAADYETSLEFNYAPIPGVEEPADLRLLRRVDATEPWAVVQADVDVNEQVIRIPRTSDVTGEWTLGSVSNSNTLSSEAPAVVTNPSPSDGNLNAPIRPLFEWADAPRARSYNLFIWKDGEPEPTQPRRGNLVEPQFKEDRDLTFGSTYNWRVVATNINGETEGPIWSFTVGSVADLTVASVEGPVTAFSGQTVELSWTVENAGDGGTNIPVWIDEVFVTEQAVFDPETAMSIGRFENLSFLDAGEQYSNTQTVTLPDGIQGTQYVHVFADAPELIKSDRLDEINEDNNTASATIEVTLSPFADLRVESVVVPLSGVFSGDSIDVQWTVTNFGSGRTDADAWLDTILLSDDDTLDFNFSAPGGGRRIRFNDRQLTSIPHLGVLEAGQSYTTSARIKLPDEAIGAFSLFVFTDTGSDRIKQDVLGDVYEFNVELNNWEGSLLDITLTPPPDLVVTDVQGPSGGQSGQKVDLSWTVENQGPGATRIGQWSDVIYFSQSASFDSASVVALGSETYRGGPLAVEGTYTGSRSVRIPDGVDGDGFFFVVADGSGRVFEHTFKSNNLGGSTEPAQVARAPYPDAQITSVVAVPAQVTAGQQVAVTYTVNNAGTAAVGRRWVDSVYVSASSTWDPFRAVGVFGFDQDAGLEPGASREQTVAVTLPADIEGQVYVFVKSDARDQFFEYPDAEKNEGRSPALSAEAYPPVDLRVELDSAPETASTGETVAVEVTISNVGQGKTLASAWFDELYLSTSDTLDARTDRSLVQLFREGALEADGEYSYTLDISLPEDIEGDVFLIARADSEGDLGEVDETNNVALSPISIGLTPPADLRAISIEAPSVVQAGQPVSVVWTVENEGTGATRSRMESGGWFDAVYLSFDRTIDSKDALLGTRERTAGLAPGETYTDTLRVVVPAYASGAYFFVVDTDTREDVYEHLAEGDNLSFERTDLMLPAPSDLTITSIDAPAEVIPGEEITLSWTVENQGDNPAQGVMREAVFVSKDVTWDLDDLLLGVTEREIDLSPGGSDQALMKVNLGASYRLGPAGDITEVLPGVEPGEYYAIVRTDISNAIRETDDGNNAASSASIEADVPVLVPGVSEAFALTAGEARYYRLDIAAGEDLRLIVSSDQPDAANELYVGINRAPVAGGEIDFAAAEPFLDAPTLVVPSTEAGTYFVLVLARSVPGNAASERVTLLAELLGFEISSITPSAGGQGQVTTRLQGAGFRDTDAVFLREVGGSRVDGLILEGGTSTQIDVRYDLDGVPLGTYDLVVKRQDGSEETVLPDAFVVEEATEPTVSVDRLIPEVFRDGGRAQFVYRYTNTGNIDIEYLEAQLQILDTPDLRVETSSGLWKSSDIFPPPDTVLSPVDYLFSSDSVYIVPLLARDVPPGTVLEATFITSTGFPGAHLYSDFAQAITTDEYLAYNVEDLLDERDFILANASRLDPETVALAADADVWVESNLQLFADTGLLDDDLLTTSFPTPTTLPAPSTLLAAANPTFSKGPLQAVRSERYATPYAVLGPTDGTPDEETPREICERGRKRAITKTCGNPHKACDCVRNIKTRCFPFFDIERDEAFQQECDNSFSECKRKMRDARKMDSSAPTTPDACGCRPRITPCDPNDIIGPDGYGDDQWVGLEQSLPYSIRFENDPERATAPAQVVRIDHPLDPDVDARSFRLADFGFGPFRFSPPANVAHFRDRLDVTDSLGVYVDVTAGIDILTREAFWVFTSVDPETGDQPRNDPFAGFLPVNNEAKDGEGFVEYTVVADSEAQTGDVIDAQARIIFDLNAPIDTPPIFNTIDADRPNSRVNSLPWKLDTTAFAIEWSGTDTGAGVARYDIYRSIDGNPFEVYAEDVTDASLLFVGEVGKNYRFYSIAEDNAGNREVVKEEGDTGTLVPIEDQSVDVPDQFALHANYPNPFNPSTTILFDVPEHSEIELTLYNTLGQRVLTIAEAELAAGRYTRQINLAHMASGVYFYEIRATGESGQRFRDVRKLVLVK